MNNTQTLLGRSDTNPAVQGRDDRTAALLGRFQQLQGVTDSFTDTDGVLLENHTPDVGSAWAKIFGPSAEIQSNEAFKPLGGFFSLYVQEVSPSGGHVMTMEVAERVGVTVGFLAHRQSGLVFYTLVYSASDGAWLIQIVNPGFVTLASLIEAEPAFPYTIEARIRYGDDSLRLLVNGVEKVSTANDDLLGGQSGMYLSGFGGIQRVDDFRLIERHGKLASINGRDDTTKTLNGRSDAAVTLLGRS